MTRAVNNYNVIKDFAFNGKLIRNGAALKIEEYDPVRGRQQLVFDSNGNAIGSLSASDYWNLIGTFIEQNKQQ